VAGKGLSAALIMSSLQARVHMLAESSPDPASALTILNRNVTKRSLPGRFITFFYGLLDPETGKLTYANAGHNHPLLLRKDGGSIELAGHSMVMGILEDVAYQTYEVTLDRGDILALFSDGVTEARAQDGTHEFGEQRLAQFLAWQRASAPSQMIADLMTHVRDWTGQTAFTDDFTMVIVKRD
jgi:serine phosphatase RsbU (regulator of sigma subunit)